MQLGAGGRQKGVTMAHKQGESAQIAVDCWGTWAQGMVVGSSASGGQGPAVGTQGIVRGRMYKLGQEKEAAGWGKGKVRGACVTARAGHVGGIYMSMAESRLLALRLACRPRPMHFSR